MEIISCVNTHSRRYNRQSFISALPLLKNIKFALPKLHSFHKPFQARERVRSICSLRDFLVAVGDFADTLSANAVRIAMAFVLVAAPFIVHVVYSYTLNFAHPLMLETIPADELEILNKMMSDFALDRVNEFDDDGNILNADGSAVVPPEASFQQPVKFQTYTVKSGDTILEIARSFGLSNISTLIAVNDIANVRQLRSGQKIRIPSIDGLVYTVQSGDSLNSLSVKYHVALEDLLDVNDLDSQILPVGMSLFIPGAKLSSDTLRNAMGELFVYPLTGKWRFTSMFGPRADPFTGVKSFHTGVDMAMPTGTPVRAAMSGKVATVGYTNIYGNYVIINHGNGYQTLYAHLSKTLVKTGVRVDQSTKIGLVGSTGYSTGPHLHFTVYKNGKLIDPMTVLKK